MVRKTLINVYCGRKTKSEIAKISFPYLSLLQKPQEKKDLLLPKVIANKQTTINIPQHFPLSLL